MVCLLLIVGVSILFLTLQRVLDGDNRINKVMLVTPEGSFPHYDIIQSCTSPNMVFAVLDPLQIVLI